MSKISREDNKKRFKTGMYPTQQDFENLFDSYVHKDDTIDPSQVVSGNENIVQIINRKAEEKHSHEIADVEGLQTVLDTLRDDLDTAEDNIAGHEQRITVLEEAKTDYEAFKERVRAFLEDANASDTTIDRWHEIENFLQGITDTETLTGLLNNLKQEILAEIPEPQTGNFIEYSTDLDAETNAPTGKIMQYWGQSTAKYKRGHFYERTEGEPFVIPAGTAFMNCGQLQNYGNLGGDVTKINGPFFPTDEKIEVLSSYKQDISSFGAPTVGGYIYYLHNAAKIPVAVVEETETEYLVKEKESYDYQYHIPKKTLQLAVYRNAEGYLMFDGYYGENNIVYGTIFNSSKEMVGGFKCSSTFEKHNTDTTISSPSTWQHLHVDDVIS